jgi:hypothetical protein
VGSTLTVVHLLPSHLQLDPAVLGEAALRDVQLAHDLHAARERVLELERRPHHLVQHPVDPVADPELLLVGLDVDVAGRPLHRVGEDQVHELDDGRVLGGLLELLDVDVLARVHQLEVHLVEIAHHRLQRGGLVVILVDRRADVHFEATTTSTL